MFTHTYRIKTQAVELADLWRVWADVNQWAVWQSDVAYVQLETAFETGGHFIFKPNGAPKLKLGLTYVSPERSFTDMTRFIGAQLLGTHEFIQHEDGVEIIISLSLSGILSGLWLHLVVNDIVKSLPAQTEALIARAIEVRG